MTIANLVEYRLLKLRPHVTQRTLDDAERARLGELSAELEWAPPERRGGRRRRYPRFHLRVPGTIESVLGERWPVSVDNVSAGGVMVSPVPQLVRGEIAFLEVVVGAHTVRLPVQAMWRSGYGRDGVLGCSFIGLPVTGALACPQGKPDTSVAAARAGLR